MSNSENRPLVPMPQSNRLETDSSPDVRPMASPISGAIEMTRMFWETRTASVAWMESVIRATAPPDNTQNFRR